MVNQRGEISDPIISSASPRHASSFHVHVNSESHLNYARLLQYNACYEAMPASSKLVIFDTELHLRKAFNGLIYQSMCKLFSL